MVWREEGRREKIKPGWDQCVGGSSGARPGPWALYPSLSSITSGPQDPLSQPSLPAVPRSYATRDGLNLNLNLYGLMALPCSSAPCLNKMQHLLGFSCPAALPGWTDVTIPPGLGLGHSTCWAQSSWWTHYQPGFTQPWQTSINTIPYFLQTGLGSWLLAIILDVSQHARRLDTCGGLLV